MQFTWIFAFLYRLIKWKVSFCDLNFHFFGPTLRSKRFRPSSSRKLGREQKRGMKGEGEGREGNAVSSSPLSLPLPCFLLSPTFAQWLDWKRLLCRLFWPQFLIHFYNSLHLRNRSILSGWGSFSISTTGNRELKQQRRRRQRKHHKTMKLRHFKLYRVYLEPLNSSNAGDFSWRWILKGFIHVRINITTFFNFPDMFRRYIRHLQWYIFWHRRWI